ncbi:hypothetical protein [Mycolicibacterium pulveris]|uniref:hypothetical protein n=1 Tax=Mycolicibacterium pulveris TaxID=36813 RepID=UPI0021F265F3|nr:hypothetical protein [Mycolicibacterium pulveris]
MAGVVIGSAVAIASAVPAHAEDLITYEVTSASISAADVQYYDDSVRKVQRRVALPWRVTVSVPDATSPTSTGAELRADWRGYGRSAFKYVTVRIYQGDRLLCESTLDVGAATCYGSTPHRNFPATAGGG